MPDENQEGSGFLRRWSRRKQHIEQTESGVPVETPASIDIELPPVAPGQEETGLSGTDAATSDLPNTVDEKPLTDEDMPPVETLTADSDYSPFLSEGVSKELRNLALKKLFFSGKFAARDGLDDYDDDFTRFEPLGDTVTSDMKFHQRRKERERLAKLEEEEQKRLAEQQEDEAHEAQPDEEADVDNASDSPELEETPMPGEPATETEAPAPAEPAAIKISDSGEASGNVEPVAAGGGKLSRKTPPDPDRLEDQTS